MVFTDRQGNELLSYRDCGTPAELIREFRLDQPRFADGLFT